ncbi:MAG: protein phosphatase 2C domain-containing protein [Dehalococcoidales bacterium]|nr:protein phosphatase 2C domain-containing protein [Dehalococcoidales bacterium]
MVTKDNISQEQSSSGSQSITEGLSVTWRAITHKGLTGKQNEDAFCVEAVETRAGLRYLLAVADGEGTNGAGAVASQTALNAVQSDLLSRRRRIADFLIEAAIQRANKGIFNLAHTQPALANMQTALALVIMERDYGQVGYAGNSRLYRLRNDNLELITSLCSRGMGTERSADINLKHERLVKYDSYFLCSDGLWKNVPEGNIAALLGANDIGESCEELVECALKAGATDDITAILFRIASIPTGKKAISPLSGRGIPK